MCILDHHTLMNSGINRGGHGKRLRPGAFVFNGERSIEINMQPSIATLGCRSSQYIVHAKCSKQEP